MFYVVMETFEAGWDVLSKVKGLIKASSPEELAKKLDAKIKSEDKNGCLVLRGKRTSKFYAGPHKLLTKIQESAEGKKVFLVSKRSKGKKKGHANGFVVASSVHALAKELKSRVVEERRLRVPCGYGDNLLIILEEEKGNNSYEVIVLNEDEVEEGLLASLQ